MLSYTCITYPSAIWLFEGQFPHDTITPDHNERQTGPKMSTVAPPHIPGWDPTDLPGLPVKDPFTVCIERVRRYCPRFWQRYRSPLGYRVRITSRRRCNHVARNLDVPPWSVYLEVKHSFRVEGEMVNFSRPAAREPPSVVHRRPSLRIRASKAAEARPVTSQLWA